MTPIRPYLLGGGASGALIGGAVAAFLSITAVVSEPQLQESSPALFPSGTGTVKIEGHHPSGEATGGRTHLGATPLQGPPLSLAVPTAAATVAPSAATVASRPAGGGGVTAGSGPPRARAGAGSGGGSNARASSPSSQSHNAPAHGQSGSHGDTVVSPNAGTGPASASPTESKLLDDSGTPPGLAKKSASAPPGLAKKPSGSAPGKVKAAGSGEVKTTIKKASGSTSKANKIPPGLAKKPHHLPPGQAKKLD